MAGEIILSDIKR